MRNPAAPAERPLGLTYLATCGGLDGTLITHVPQWTWMQAATQDDAVYYMNSLQTLPVTNRTVGGGWRIPGGVNVAVDSYVLNTPTITYESPQAYALPHTGPAVSIPAPDAADGRPDMWRDRRAIIEAYTHGQAAQPHRLLVWGNSWHDQGAVTALTTYVATQGNAVPVGQTANTWPQDWPWIQSQVPGAAGVSVTSLGRTAYGALAAAYPADLQGTHTTLMLMAHGILHGAGETLTLRLDRGDMVIVTTSDNSTIDTSGMVVANQADLNAQVTARLPAGGQAAENAWAMNTWIGGAAVAGPATIVTHDTGADYTLYWHVRPVYDLGRTASYSSQQMVIPKYLISNQASLTCSVWAFEANLLSRATSLLAWTHTNAHGDRRLTSYVGAASADVVRECDPGGQSPPAGRALDFIDAPVVF